MESKMANGNDEIGNATLDARVSGIAQKLNSDQEFGNEVSTVLQAAKDRVRGPAALWLRIEKVLSKDEIASLPIVGTKRDKDNPHTQNPDYYSVSVKGVKVSGSYYGDLAKRYSHGAKLAVEAAYLKHLADSEKNPMPVGVPKEMVDHYKSINRSDRDNALDDAQKSLNNLAAALRKAAKLGQSLAAAKEYPDIRAGILNDKGVVRRVNKTVRVMNRDKSNELAASDYKDYTPDGFTAINWVKFGELGGKFEHLDKASERGANQQKKTTGLTIEASNILDTTSAIVIFNQDHMAVLTGLLQGKGMGMEEADMLLWNIFEMVEAYKPIVEGERYGERIRDMIAKKREVEAAERAAKAKGKAA
jgi:hypothetical protein